MLGVWAWITSRVGRVASAAVGILLAALYLFKRGERKGAEKVKSAVGAKTVEKVVETVKKEKEIEKEVKSTPASERRERLRGFATTSDSDK